MLKQLERKNGNPILQVLAKRHRRRMKSMIIAILITHGTDTLAWTHAAVRYAVKHNKVNIALTGSQIPMPEGH